MTASTKNVTVFVATATLLLALTIPATIADHAALTRTKRQLPPLEQGNQVIDDIFQIPITTLNAVGSLIKSARPLVRRTRERIQQFYNGQQQQPSVSQYSTYTRPSPQQQYVSYSRPSLSQFPYNGFSGSTNRRRPQQSRDDPVPQGRHRGHDDY